MFRFGIVGGLAFLIDYSILFILNKFLGIHYLLAGTISFSCSVIFNYILSTKWVFDVREDANKFEERVIFIVLSVIGLGINSLLMYLFVDKLKIAVMISKIGATAIVMVYNYVSRKLLIEQR